MKNKIKKTGFTLVELLVVISIISILTIISLASFKSVQVKARDSQRKSDLDALSKALMMYFNDNGNFPVDDVINNNWGNVNTGFTGPGEIVYMRKMPIDPKGSSPYEYVYKVDHTKKFFNLFANLENTKDSQLNLGYWPSGVDVGVSYLYGVSSPNTILQDW